MKDPKSKSSTRPTTKRKPIGKRIGDGARTLGEVGDDLVNRPGVLPGKAHNWFRKWFGKVWRVRGGGLYACGYAVTFVVLEIRTIVGEFVESDSLGAFVQEQLVEFVFRFAIDSLMNMIYAFAWPAYVAQYSPPVGVIALGAAFILFPITLKKPIERWLFPDGETGEPS